LFKKNNLIPFGLIILAGIFVYFKSLSFGLVYLDDNALMGTYKTIISNPLNFFWIFTQPCAGLYYRPIVDVVYMVDTILGNGSYFVYHLTNLILHILASLLLYVFLLKLFSPKKEIATKKITKKNIKIQYDDANIPKNIALIMSLFFVVHPVVTRSVAWISGRNDLILGIFVLLAFIYFFNFLETQKLKFKDYFGCIVAFGLALFTKETAIAFPILLISFFFFPNFFNSKNKFKNFMLYFGYFCVIILWIIMRQKVLAGTHMTLSAGLKEFSNNFPALLQYFGKTLLPFKLSVAPVIQDTPFIFGIFSVLIISVLLILVKKINYRIILFGIFWFLLFLVPVLFAPYQSTVTHFFEYRLYVPLIGVIIILAEIFSKLINFKHFQNKNFLIFANLVIILFGYLAFSHTLEFKDKISFWESAVKTSPHSPLAHRNLGVGYYFDGKLDLAEKEYLASLNLNPAEPMVNNNLGLIYMQKKMFEETEKYFKQELVVNPEYDNAYFNLGLLYAKTGRRIDAIFAFEKTLQINPEYPDAKKYLEMLKK
jgi:tetratricopeptide (TPR) repeat protein